jgi:hypothetical protein
VSDVYEFIDAEYATCETAPAIRCMCAWLEVSKSGFYEWRSRPQSAAARRRGELGLLLRHQVEHFAGVRAGQQPPGHFRACLRPPLPPARLLVQPGVLGRHARRGCQGDDDGLVFLVELAAVFSVR